LSVRTILRRITRVTGEWITLTVSVNVSSFVRSVLQTFATEIAIVVICDLFSDSESLPVLHVRVAASLSAVSSANIHSE
jgi:hypothetical protein